jgi:hypothetical protein
MTTAELVARYQLLADDAVGSGRLSDANLQSIFLEAETEAAIRARLLHESQDAGLCRISVTSGTSSYWLHPSLYELTHVAFVDASGVRYPVKLVSTEALDHEREAMSRLTPPSGDDYDINLGQDDWRDATGSVPVYAIQTDQMIRLVPTPTASGTLHMEGYRTPLREADDDPEIGEIHHPHLVQWAIYRRFEIPDEDHFDGKRAEVALARFEQYFGLRPDADLRRLTRHDTPHQIEAFFV